MKLNNFFGLRMTEVLEFFILNSTKIFSSADLMQALKLNKTDRQSIDKCIFCLFKIGFLTRLKTKGDTLEYEIVAEHNKKRLKYYYGLNMKNSITQSFIDVLTLVKKVNDYRGSHITISRENQS